MITHAFVELNVGKQNDCDCCKGKKTSARSGRSRYPGQRSMTAGSLATARALRLPPKNTPTFCMSHYNIQNKNIYVLVTFKFFFFFQTNLMTLTHFLISVSSGALVKALKVGVVFAVAVAAGAAAAVAPWCRCPAIVPCCT